MYAFTMDVVEELLNAWPGLVRLLFSDVGGAILLVSFALFYEEG